MKLAAAVLAAGASSRLGRPKQLVELRGETLLHRSARLALEAGCDPVLVVLGAEAEMMAAALAGLSAKAALNPGWTEGVASSIRCAMAALPGDVGAVMLLACDQWALEGADFQRLVQAFRSAPVQVAAASYARTLGIPAIFPKARFAELQALAGDRGAKPLLRGAVTAVPMPRGATDLDLPEELLDLP